jgi:hypothetical protein
MQRLAVGEVVEEVYRIDSVLSESDRAHVYGVTHARFPEVPLAMKVAAPNRALDFDRDTSALASLTGPCFTRVVDRAKLPDGRYYRVMERLAGPSLRAALASSAFDEDRAMELLVALAAAVHEAQQSSIGPCDLSLDNLVFANGRDGGLCLVRAIVPFASGPDPAADQRALASLCNVLLRGLTRTGAHEPAAHVWKPPSSVEEIREAIATRSGRITPASSSPGTSIGRWEVVRRISETLHATVYEVTSNRQRGMLKVPGPQADHASFTKQADLLARVQSRNVVRVVDFGTWQGTPFMVMDPLHQTQATRLEHGAPLAIDAALQTVDELLWGAEAISKYGGSPSDFSLEHCYQATREPSPAVLTRAMTALPAFGIYGKPQSPDHADAWSAAVALYELIAARLPFPTSKHSLAKAWMGMPVQLASRRRDVPPDISELVHAVLTGKRVTTADLRREITRIRSAPGTLRKSAPPERISVTPGPIDGAAPTPSAKASPGPARVFAVTEQAFAAPSAGLRALVENAGPVLPAIPMVVDVPPAHEGMRRSIEPPMPNARHVEIGAPSFELHVTEPHCPLGSLSRAAFSADGAELVAVGQDAVARHRAGRWTVDPARIAPAEILSLVPMQDGFLALTSSGPLLRLGPSGGFSPWGVALDQYVFRGAVPDGQGFTLVGGTRDKTHGVLARLVGESLTILNDALDVRPLRAATYLSDGALLAAAEDGTIVVLRQSAITESLRPANVTLLAARVVGSDTVVVGAGAWAFRITTKPLTADLEAVDTQSALTCLAFDGTHAWAGSDKGRILRRTDRHWKRMNRSFDGDPEVLALHASKERVTAVLASGQIALGRQTG